MKYLPIILILLISSCKSDSIPKDVLPPEKMQAVLWDMIRADEFLVSYVFRDTSFNRKAESVKMYETVFEVHDITKSTFEKSFKYYQQNPKILKPIMDTLQAWNTDRDLIKPIPLEEEKILDSILGKKLNQISVKPVKPVDSTNRK